MNLKPMLAETLEDSSKLAYPVLASPKLDGIRCLIVNGQAVSRNLKPIRNPHVQAWVQKYGPAVEGLDGELISGEHDETVFNRTTSVVMSSDGGPEFTFWCFDRWDQPDIGYTSRMRAKRAAIGEHGTPSNFRWVPGKVCTNEEELRAYEDECLQRGFEGVMVRDPVGRYKYGRSTVKEALLLKVKRFVDAEAVVIGFGERMHNENEATTDALGHTERSTHKAGMKPAGDLGYLLVQDTETGRTFQIGSGFTAEQRVDFWKRQNKLFQKLVKYKHFPIGAVDKPRFPVFVGWRHEDDTSG